MAMMKKKMGSGERPIPPGKTQGKSNGLQKQTSRGISKPPVKKPIAPKEKPKVKEPNVPSDVKKPKESMTPGMAPGVVKNPRKK